jgi:hypothetical protein
MCSTPDIKIGIQMLLQHWSMCVENNGVAFKAEMQSFLIVSEIEHLLFSFEWPL